MIRYGAHVQAGGIRQHYLRFAEREGTPLVLVPGITSPAAVWAFVGERLAKEFDVYILDVRGRGLSQSEPGLDYSVDTCAADLIEFCGALGLDRPIWMGHSMGARIASRAARSAPAIASRLVLVDPPVSGPGRRPYPIVLDTYLHLLAEARAGRAYDALRGKTDWPDDLIRVRAEWAHTCCEAAVIRAHRDFHENNFHADLPFLTMPVDLITAGRGGVIRDEDIVELSALAPLFRHRTVTNAGHMIPFEDYDGFFSSLNDLLGVQL